VTIYRSPGWIDVQVNGFTGFDINNPALSVDDVLSITRRLWQEGVTAWCPTVITAPTEQIERNLGVIRQACEIEALVQACVVGIHLEGPYISGEDGARGAHSARYVHPPNWEEFTRWQQAAGGLIRIVTLAPEQPGGIEFIMRLSQSDVIPALGHTRASAECIRQAVDAGARLSTHLGNGIEAILPRHANPIWAQLADDRLSASLVFDGFHLPTDVMKVMLKSKGYERCLLVSDATNLTGLQPGVYETHVGGKVQLHPDGKLSLYGTEYLAGSASSLKTGIENGLRLSGGLLPEVIAMVTTNPAKLLSLKQNASTLFVIDPLTYQIKILSVGIEDHNVYQNPDWIFE
jgi:N-acetylglucosamine-6-phosphate deacetylase